MMVMDTLATRIQWTISPLTFKSFLSPQFQPIQEKEELEEEENIEFNNVQE